MEEIIADRAADLADRISSLETSLGIQSGLELVRGSGLAMLRGWHLAEQRTPVTVICVPQHDVRVVSLLLAPSDAANWIIHDIRIAKADGWGNEITTWGSTPVPGSEFSGDRPNPLQLELPVVVAGMQIKIDVEYIGDRVDGEPFHGALWCDVRGRGRATIAVTSGAPIGRRDEDGIRAWIQLDDRMYRFEGRQRRLDRIVSVPHMPTSLESIGHGLELAPRMVSLHVVTLPFEGCAIPEYALIGIDDATSRIVFEFGNTYRNDAAGESSGAWSMYFQAKCDPAGYIPNWWDFMQLIKWDLREPFGPPTGAG